jgi:hypothetical protein
MHNKKSNAAEIERHFQELANGVHEDLKAKGIQGLRVTGMQFGQAADTQCPKGTVWKCVEDPETGGVKCGCFPI